MRQRVATITLTLTLVLMPAILGAAMLYARMDGALFWQFAPLSSDEVFYWHQGASATAYPLATGYYTNNEVPPAWTPFGRFAYWGPFVPHLYALFGRVLGWETYTPLIANLIIVTIALAAFVWRVRPNVEALAWLNGVLLTFIPLWLYIPTGLTEVLHQASAIGLAAVLWPLLRDESPPPARARWVAFAYLSLITITLRVTWGILFLPLVVLWRRDAWRRWRLVAWLGAAIAYLLGLYAARSAMWTEFPEQFNQRVRYAFSQSFADGVAVWREHFLYNLNGMHWSPVTNQWFFFGLRGLVSALIAAAVFLWLRERWLNGARGHWPHIGAVTLLSAGLFLMWDPIHYGVWPLAWQVSGGVLVVYAFLMWLRVRLRGDVVSAWEVGFHLWNLFVITAVITVFYDTFDWRGYRTIAPHLLVTLLLLAAMRRRWLVLPLMAFALLSVRDASVVYGDYYWAGGKFSPTHQPSPLVGELAELLTVDPTPANGWCNSVTMDHWLPESLLSLPPGMGFNLAYYVHGRKIIPVESWFNAQYLWMSEGLHDAHGGEGRTEQLGTVNGVPLYRNLESACTP